MRTIRYAFLAALLSLAAAIDASAQLPRGIAWARVTNDGSVVAGSYSSNGGAVTVAKRGTGTYVVTFVDNNLYGGVGHAVASNGNRYCNIGRSWNFAADSAVDVLCSSADGTRAASDFVVLFYKEQRETAEWHSAYVFADQPTTASYTPAVQWHGRGGTVTVRRGGVGRYAAEFPNLAPLGRPVNYLVTAFDSNAHCEINGYGQGGGVGGGMSAGVLCVDPAGAFVDTRFVLSVITDFNVGLEFAFEQRRGAYLFSNREYLELEYTPGPLQQLSLGSGPLRVRRLAVGEYEVDAPGLDPAAIVMITGGQSGGYCSLGVQRPGPAGGMVVPVNCYAVDGQPVNSLFMMTILHMDANAIMPLPGGDGPTRATAWVRYQGSPTYALDALNQFNPTGATPVLFSYLSGHRVSFPGLASAGGIVHVVANGPGFCKATSWGPNGTALDVLVTCFSPAGSDDASLPFTLLFYKEDRATAPATYARAMVGNNTKTYSAPTPYAWSGFGEATKIARTGVGQYEVRFGPVTPTQPLVALATPYGQAPIRCKAAITSTGVATVKCHDTDDAYADSDFGVSIFGAFGFGGASAGPPQTGAYARAHVNNGTYAPTAGFWVNTTGGAISLTRTGVGSYTADLPGLKPSNRTVAIVSAYGAGGLNGSAQCRPAGWVPTPPSGGGTRLTVECADGYASVDEPFTLLYLTDAGNGAPTISTIPNRTVPRGTSTGVMAFTVTDDTNAGAVVLTVSSSDPTVVPMSNILLGGSGTNRTLTVFAPPNQVGASEITLTARDESGFTSTESFTVTVTSVHPLTVTRAGTGTGTVGSQPFGVNCGAACTVAFAESSVVTLTATPTAGSVFAGWSGAGCSGTGTCVVTMDAAKSVTATFGLVPKTYYLAEGATGPFFDLEVVIANPNDVDVPVEMTFLDAGGNTYPLAFTLGAKRSRTVAVESEVPALGSAEVSTIVTSPTGRPLVVERSLFWDQTYYGGHTGSAVDGPQTTWYFGEGFQSSPVFDTFLLLANANNAPAQVTLTFLRQGATPVTTTKTIAATSRANVWAAEVPELTGQSFSTVVTSDLPIIAERAMYFGTPTFNGGHESAGVAAPSTSWFHAEGRTGPFFDTYILIGNPGDMPANVTVRFLRANDTPITTTVTVAAHGRETIYVDGIAGLPNTDVSTEVTSDVPVISERSMYWPGDFAQWYEAHNSFGVTSTGLAWGLAEGRFGFPPHFETYILLTNPTATSTRVRVTFLRQGSKAPVVSEQLLGANARANVDMSALQAAPDYDAAGERFGTLVESLDNVGIVVERALYFTSGGVFWAGGTNAAAVKIR